MVTCRTEQYRDAVRPPGGAEVTLRAAAAIQLRPLDADSVRDYLCDDAAGPAARARWAPVFAVLGTGAPAAHALGRPLMVGLARTIYNPMPGERAGALRDPAELCNSALQDRMAVESLLFDAFISAAYRPPTAGRWTAQQAEPWLTAGLGGVAGGSSLDRGTGVVTGIVVGFITGIIVVAGVVLRARYAARVSSAETPPTRGVRISDTRPDQLAFRCSTCSGLHSRFAC